MRRREFAAASATLSLSGCLGLFGGGGGDGGDDRTTAEPFNDVGEAVEKDGLRVTIEEWEPVRRYATVAPNPQDRAPPEDREYRTPPTAGGAFLMLFVSIEHVGKDRRSFPRGEDVSLTYRDNETQRFLPESTFETGNNKLFDSYAAKIEEWDAHENGVYPGVTLDGWVLFEVPQQFVPASAVATVGWATRDGDTTSARWRLGSGDDAGTTEGG